MRIVLDTNVLVSGLLSPFGAPARVVQLAVSGAIRLCFDTRLETEYRQVLGRPAFPFGPHQVEVLLSQLSALGEWVDAHPLSRPLPDPDDEPFLEVALAAMADCLVTGNLKHFPVSSRRGVPVLSPSHFLDLHRECLARGLERDRPPADPA